MLLTTLDQAIVLAVSYVGHLMLEKRSLFRHVLIAPAKWLPST